MTFSITPQEQQIILNAALDSDRSIAADNEIISFQLLELKGLAIRLSDVKTLINKELELMNITTPPEFFGKLLIDLTKYGPSFLLAPTNSSLAKAKETSINSLKEKLLKLTPKPFAQETSLIIQKYFEHHFAVDYQDYLSKADPKEASLLLNLTDKLAEKTQDFLSFQKFCLLQIDFLSAKIKKIYETSKNFCTEEIVRIMISSVIPWLSEISNCFYKAFDPYYNDFSEGNLDCKKTLVNQQLEMPWQRKMSAPLDPKILESTGNAPAYINRTKSAKEKATPMEQPKTQLGPKEIALIKEYATKANDRLSKLEEAREKAKKGDNIYKLDDDLYMIMDYLQYNDIQEVESVTLPQKLLMASQRALN